jgi:hypothetical protein
MTKEDRARKSPNPVATERGRKKPSEEPRPAEGFDYGKLALRSPLAEFEEHTRAKIKVAERVGDANEIDLYLEALELGRALLKKPEGRP